MKVAKMQKQNQKNQFWAILGHFSADAFWANFGPAWGATDNTSENHSDGKKDSLSLAINRNHKHGLARKGGMSGGERGNRYFGFPDHENKILQFL